MGCPFADFTVHAVPIQSSEAPPILSTDTVAKQPKPDNDELKACPV
jgi:hypothetical protein